MVDTLPPGFQIDSPSQGAPSGPSGDLPAGFVLDSPDGSPEAPETASSPIRPVDAITRTALDRIANNLLSIPALGERLGREGLQALGLDVGDETFLPRGNVAPVRAVGQMGETAVQRLMAGDIPGALQAATEFDPALEQVEAETARVAQERPGAARIGEMTGDVASLLLAGRPIMRAGARGVQSATRAAGATTAQSFPRITRALETARNRPGTIRLVDDALKSQFSGRVAGGVGKAVETGLEGVTLAILDEGDPVTSGLASAGFQAGGSLSRDALRRIGSRGVGAGIMGSAMTIFLLQNFIPGGRNFVTEAFETARDKFSLAILAGAGAAALGTGRPGAGAIANNFPKIAREFRAAVRGGVIDTVRELAGNRESGNLVPEQVLSRMSRDPVFFSPGAVKKIAAAMRDRRKSVTSTIERMIRDDTGFRAKVSSLALSPAPSTEAAPTGPTPTGAPPQSPLLVP